MSLAGDLDLVVSNEDDDLIYIENTGTSTVPVFVFQHFKSSYSYLYDDDYVQPSSYSNLFAGIYVGGEITPALADFDGDGTL